jgi:La-related protein 7
LNKYDMFWNEAIVLYSVNWKSDETTVGSKKGWARGRGKGRGRTQNHTGRGLLAPPSPSSSIALSEVSTKPNAKGPRMPDGTRGFAVGRGKPISSPASPQE